MLNEIKRKISTDEPLKQNMLDSRIFMGEGNINADYIIIYEKIDNQLIDNKTIFETKNYEQIAKILDYTKIDKKNCYFTHLIKSSVKNTDDNIRKKYMKYLLEEIYIVKPKYIYVIGENLLNFIYRYYNKNFKLEFLDINKIIGNLYEFYGMGLLPIPDIESIKRLDNSKKSLLYNSIKEAK